MGEEATDGVVWVLEAVRFPQPVTRWTSALFTSVETVAAAEVMEETGTLLDGVAIREFDGRLYSATVPLASLHAPPPRWLVPILCRAHPVLRRRLAAAHAADVTDWAGRMVEEWQGGKEDDLLERGRGFLAGDLGALTTDQVAARLEEQLRFVGESFTWRARLHAAGVDAIGRLGLELTGQRGWTVAEVMDLFIGLSGTVTDPAEAQRTIVELVRQADGLAALQSARTLADVAAISAPVATALQGYQDLWGQRAVRLEVAAPTVIDRPEWLLRQLKGAAGPAAEQRELAERHTVTRTGAEARLIATLGNSSLTRRRLARARQVFPLREGNTAATIGVPLAGMRRLGLHIGERLGLYRPDDVFDLTFDEVLDALRLPDLAPLDGDAEPARVALARREERERMALKEPPLVIGGAGPGGAVSAPSGSADGLGASLRGFPRSAAEQLAAFTWYRDQSGAPMAERPPTDGDLRGLGVSPGVYEGTARVVRDEDDFERLEAGDVMVCPTTSPAWSMVFPSLGALVCDGGGALSHPAIIAREFGIPAVVATGAGTAALADGAWVRVDGGTGLVIALD